MLDRGLYRSDCILGRIDIAAEMLQGKIKRSVIDRVFNKRTKEIHLGNIEASVDATIDPARNLHRMMVAAVIAKGHSLSRVHESAVRKNLTLSVGVQNAKVLGNNGC